MLMRVAGAPDRPPRHGYSVRELARPKRLAMLSGIATMSTEGAKIASQAILVLDREAMDSFRFLLWRPFVGRSVGMKWERREQRMSLRIAFGGLRAVGGISFSS